MTVSDLHHVPAPPVRRYWMAVAAYVVVTLCLHRDPAPGALFRPL